MKSPKFNNNWINNQDSIFSKTKTVTEKSYSLFSTCFYTLLSVFRLIFLYQSLQRRSLPRSCETDCTQSIDSLVNNLTRSVIERRVKYTKNKKSKARTGWFVWRGDGSDKTKTRRQTSAVSNRSRRFFRGSMERGRGGELQVCEINGGKRRAGCSTGIQVEIDWIVCGQFSAVYTAGGGRRGCHSEMNKACSNGTPTSREFLSAFGREFGRTTFWQLSWTSSSTWVAFASIVSRNYPRLSDILGVAATLNALIAVFLRSSFLSFSFFRSICRNDTCVCRNVRRNYIKYSVQIDFHRIRVIQARWRTQAITAKKKIFKNHVKKELDESRLKIS